MIFKLGFNQIDYFQMYPIHKNTGIYYVYLYIDPETKIPFYVGKGKNERYLYHIKEAKKFKLKPFKCNRHKIYKILQILDKGLEPTITKLYDKVCELDALELESQINNFMEDHLTNILKGEDSKRGGDTLTNHPDYEEICQRMKNAHQQNKTSVGEKNPMYGRCAYDIWVEKYGKEEADKKLLLANERKSIAVSGENNYQKKMTPQELKNKNWKYHKTDEELNIIYEQFSGDNNGYTKKKIKEWSYLVGLLDKNLVDKVIEVWNNEKTFTLEYIIKLFDIDRKYIIAVLRLNKILIREKFNKRHFDKELNFYRKKYNIKIQEEI